MRIFLFTILMTAMMSSFADDTDALSLADKTSSDTERASDWHIFTEGALGTTSQRYGSPTLHMQRWSLDVQYDQTLAPGWRVLMSDRVDLTSTDKFEQHAAVNMLKEAYVSWQPSSSQIVDLGRINARNGVALGYNPTDYFRTGALRSITSVDPASLKKNRLGSVMLRGQKLWNSGSLTALYSPKLASQPNDAPFNVDLGATNNTDRWLLSASQKIADHFNPQWIIFSESHHSPQLGVNLTGVLNDATVAYAEWSGGRSRSLFSQAFNTADDKAFRSRLATGLTYTTENKISFTLEYDYNGAGLDRHELGQSELAASRNPSLYVQYRKWVQNIQDPITKQSAFIYSTWQDAMINHLDLTAMVRINVADHSRLTWTEARYHWNHADLALQWQLNSGNAGSEFGFLPQQRSIQVIGTYFF